MFDKYNEKRSGNSKKMSKPLLQIMKLFSFLLLI